MNKQDELTAELGKDTTDNDPTYQMFGTRSKISSPNAERIIKEHLSR